MTAQTACAKGAADGTRYSLDDLLGIGDLAARLHVSEKTVRDWIYRRRMPFTKVGRRVYFSRSVVEAILAGNAVEPRSGSLGGNRPRLMPTKGGVQERRLSHG